MQNCGVERSKRSETYAHVMLTVTYCSAGHPLYVLLTALHLVTFPFVKYSKANCMLNTSQ